MTSTIRSLVSNAKTIKDETNSNEKISSLLRESNSNLYEPPQLAYDRPTLVMQTIQVFAATMYLETANQTQPSFD